MTMRHKKEIGIQEMESKIVKGASFCTLDHLTHAITKSITRLNGQSISTQYFIMDKRTIRILWEYEAICNSSNILYHFF